MRFDCTAPVSAHSALEEIRSVVQEHRGSFLEQLKRFVAQPSVSATGEGVEDCAKMTEGVLKQLGFRTSTYRPGGTYPVVYGELKSLRSSKTLLLYNHYDVQPVDPLDEWKTPPFEPRVIQGKLYGRGVADDKGDFIARACAIQALQEKSSELPVSLKWVVEGEEEEGSVHLHEYVESHAKELGADACLWEGSELNPKGRPHFYLGVKGLLYVEISLKTAEGDRHSMNAPIIPNPAWKLVWALSKMKGDNEEIKIGGFYDDVRRPSKEDLAMLEEIEFDDEETMRLLGVKAFLGGLKGTKLLERLVFSPTCNIAGFGSGYTGPGSKTIVPGRGMVKIDFRLVPDQKPHDILLKLKKFLEDQGLADAEVTVFGEEMPARTSPSTPVVRAASDACRQVYGVDPNVWPSMYATGPMALFNNIARVPSVMVNSVAYPGSSYHAPNEHIFVDHYLKGIEHLALTFFLYGS